MSAGIKQVLVIRKDLNVRKGKMIAQGAHASLMSYLRSLANRANFTLVHEWLTTHKQTKICVGVESEEELKEIFKKAEAADLPCSLVLDAAHTEFDQPTYTACGIGPAESEKIDLITGHLKLL